jgi:2-polyprenyl-3-methyl-5-hydroxy-6-metoxy-1,4-benzoquinol methylase
VRNQTRIASPRWYTDGTLSAIERDFDRLALFDEDGWTVNSHYHDFLLRHVPANCERVLEIGCGTGAFSRALARQAKRVTAIDLSSEMIRVAVSRSPQLPQIEFEVADVMTRVLPNSQFDCIATIATLHHLSHADLLLRLKDTLRPGGKLIVLDLYQPETNLLTTTGLTDHFLNVVALGTSVTLRLLHKGRPRPSREARAAWKAHGKTDRYLTMDEARRVYGSILPGVLIRKHLFWRYSAIWTKPNPGL